MLEEVPRRESPRKDEPPQPYPHWLVAQCFTLGATIPATTVASYVLLTGGTSAKMALAFALSSVVMTGIGFYGHAAIGVRKEREAQRPQPPAAPAPVTREHEP